MTTAPTRTRRTAQATTVLALAAAFLLPAAAPAGAASATIGMAVEGWYQGSLIPDDHPLCVLPCPQIPLPESSYPEDTLHVGVSGGRETARTYVELDLSSLPLPVTLTRGTVVLPVAGADAGTTAPELADLVACPVAGFVQPAHGGPPDQAPKVDCSTSTPLTFDADEQAFTTDLAPLLFGDPTYADLPLAILASERAQEEAATWRVAFHGKDRDTEDAEPITATVQFLPAESPGGALPTTDPAGPSNPPAGPRPDTPAPTPSLQLPPPTAQPPATTHGNDLAAAPPVVADPAPTPTPQPIAAAPVAAGYAYPQVWLLPLLVLLVGTLLVQSLTREYEIDPSTVAVARDKR